MVASHTGTGQDQNLRMSSHLDNRINCLLLDVPTPRTNGGLLRSALTDCIRRQSGQTPLLWRAKELTSEKRLVPVSLIREESGKWHSEGSPWPMGRRDPSLSLALPLTSELAYLLWEHSLFKAKQGHGPSPEEGQHPRLKMNKAYFIT